MVCIYEWRCAIFELFLKALMCFGEPLSSWARGHGTTWHPGLPALGLEVGRPAGGSFPRASVNPYLERSQRWGHPE